MSVGSAQISVLEGGSGLPEEGLDGGGPIYGNWTQTLRSGEVWMITGADLLDLSVVSGQTWVEWDPYSFSYWTDGTMHAEVAGVVFLWIRYDLRVPDNGFTDITPRDVIVSVSGTNLVSMRVAKDVICGDREWGIGLWGPVAWCQSCG